MFRKSNALLAAATAYVDQGIAVRPAPALVRAPAGQDAFGRWVCACRDLACLEPGQHPEPGVEWITDPDAVRAVWDTEIPPNLLISSGPAVALWRLPRVVGAFGLRLFEQHRPGPWPPYMKRSDGDWVIATQPAEEDIELTLAAGVMFFEPGVPVLVPPSRRPGAPDSLVQRLLEPTGRLRWLQSPSFPDAPLPTAAAVLDLVRQAEQEQHDLLYGAAEGQQAS